MSDTTEDISSTDDIVSDDIVSQWDKTLPRSNSESIKPDTGFKGVKEDIVEPDTFMGYDNALDIMQMSLDKGLSSSELEKESHYQQIKSENQYPQEHHTKQPTKKYRKKKPNIKFVERKLPIPTQGNGVNVINNQFPPQKILWVAETQKQIDKKINQLYEDLITSVKLLAGDQKSGIIVEFEYKDIPKIFDNIDLVIAGDLEEGLLRVNTPDGGVYKFSVVNLFCLIKLVEETVNKGLSDNFISIKRDIQQNDNVLITYTVNYHDHDSLRPKPIHTPLNEESTNTNTNPENNTNSDKVVYRRRIRYVYPQYQQPVQQPVQLVYIAPTHLYYRQQTQVADAYHRQVLEYSDKFSIIEKLRYSDKKGRPYTQTIERQISKFN